MTILTNKAVETELDGFISWPDYRPCGHYTRGPHTRASVHNPSVQGAFLEILDPSREALLLLDERVDLVRTFLALKE